MVAWCNSEKVEVACCTTSKKGCVGSSVLQGALAGTVRTQIAATYLFDGIQSSDPESASAERPRSLFVGLDMGYLSN